MIEWVVTSSLMILIVTALRFLFRGKISRRLQYALWGLVLLKLLIPYPLFGSPISVMNVIQPSAITNSITDIRVYSDIIRDTDASQEEAKLVGKGELHEIQGPSWQKGQNYLFTDSLDVVFGHMFSVLWLIVGIAVALGIIFVNLGFYIRLRKTRTSWSGAHCHLPAYVTGSIASPCLFGFFRPAIYITPKAAENEGNIPFVITHEYCHYRHGDHIWSFFRGICLAVWWWNPLVWIAAILSRQDSELACDEAVLKELGAESRFDYGRTLVEMIPVNEDSPGLMHGTTAMVSGKGSIKARLNMIIKNPKTFLPALAVVVFIAIVSIGCTFTGEKIEPLTAQEALRKLEESVSRTGKEVSFIIPKGYGNPKEWDIRITGRRFAENINLMEYISNNKAWKPGGRYTVSIDSMYTGLTLTAFLPGEVEKTIDLLNPAGNVPFPEVNMIFTLPPKFYSHNIPLEEIGMDAATYYYSQFMGEDIPKYWHITKHEILTSQLMAGDGKEFAVWVTSYIETDGAGFLIGSGRPYENDDISKGGICPEVGKQFRIKSIEGGRYEIISIGTGGGTQGLEPVGVDGDTENMIAMRIETIASSPAYMSNPGAYIEAHPKEYEELIGYGDATVRYCFELFEQGGQTDLKGHIMAIACREILGGAWDDALYNTGQDWYDFNRQGLNN